MKLTTLLHNSKAGRGKYTPANLISIIQSQGFQCTNTAIKKSVLKKLTPAIDFLVVAGGDGTLRKVVSKLLKRKLLDKHFPIALLPTGTANNFAKTLGINGKDEEIIEGWKNAEIKKVDVGKIYNIPEAQFFLESFGYGLFPRLMKEMKGLDKKLKDTPEKKMKMALQVLDELITEYEPSFCKLEVDGVDYSGEYILVEIMNTATIGPNLNFAQDSDPGDGVLEVVLIKASQKDAFSSYIRKKIEGVEEPFRPLIIKGRNIKLLWEGNDVHVDDELIEIRNPADVTIELHPGLLEFLVPSIL
ncbi:diacylglycerol/lipid kinase family protein [Rubrolithibacter danxiaensis]|uniref:diacylglycerol/lipid kinase family protein n=1 Tax=Rubrolithibacter danxiaensis TaxID=3390805 RepID=UPI003BF8D758